MWVTGKEWLLNIREENVTFNKAEFCPKITGEKTKTISLRGGGAQRGDVIHAVTYIFPSFFPPQKEEGSFSLTRSPTHWKAFPVWKARRPNSIMGD